MKETDLFPPLKIWLEERSYEVFTEVQSSYTGGRADIVAVSGPVVSVVEMKTSLSLELIGQAMRWRPFANFIYIAIPYSTRRTHLAQEILRKEGIGLLQVDLMHRYGKSVFNPLRANFNRRINNHIRESLVEDHKILAGGHAGGGYVTKYSQTIKRVKEFLNSWHVRTQQDGWATMAQILDHCETHYSSPKASLAAAMKGWESEFFETKVENRKLHFRLKVVKND